MNFVRGLGLANFEKLRDDNRERFETGKKGSPVRSASLSSGIYQFEFMEDKIAVAKWDEPPKSTIQWAKVVCSGSFHFEGTCIEDIRVVEE